ncbi:unnamed protein product [Hanseniaspora opuntiae]
MFDHTIVVTGGSQGLGLELAKYHYNNNTKTCIVILSRSESKLINAASKITNDKFLSLKEFHQNSLRLYYHPIDLSNGSDVENLLPLLANLPPIQRTYLTAGGASVKLFKDYSINELQQGINMNYSSSLFLSHVLLKNHLCKHLVYFSSEVSFFPFIGYSSYTPSKTSLKSLVNILRQEFPDCRLTNVFPGNFASEGYIEENLTKPEITKDIEGSSKPISVEKCREIIINDINRSYDDITTDFIGWVLMACDMGLNKNWNYSKFWFLQLILGVVANLFIIPIYMIILKYDINKYLRKNAKLTDKDKAQ